MSFIKHGLRLALLSVSGAAWAATPTAPTNHPQREVLPDRVVPVHYELSLTPDAEALTFTGKVAITIEVRTAGRSVTLNAVGLEFDHTTLDGGADASVRVDAGLGRATLTFGAPIAPGQHLLAIEYHGKIARSTIGFFAMDYVGSEGPRRTLATNFEPADARDLLPCWDEPGRKATFTVSIDAPKDRMAVSNMPVDHITSLSPTTQRVHFAQTPKMSTYLLFVGVGDFERVHDRVDGVDIGVVVKRGDSAKGAYALEQAGKILHYYNEYFGVAFPLPKLDLIAAPGQIQGGSMENWGAIFYSQNHLLFDPGTSTEQDRQTVFVVVAHEMAHQWFGDLVTMAWWDDLWLNEGFARWMQVFVADDLHPEWETGLQAADDLTSMANRPMPCRPPIRWSRKWMTADQAEQSFDSITYDKGAAVITMLNAYVGREKFRDGVRRYMRAHAYGNTVDTDLWRPIEQAVGRPIVGIERDFTRQEGLPLVTVSRTGQGVHLMQSRFADDPASISKLPRQRWRLPLALGPIEGPTSYLLLQGAADVAQPPPLLVNAGQTGYARVLYTSGTLNGLTARLGALAAVDQIGLLNDARSLGFASVAPATNLLRLMTALPANANPIVWQRVLQVLLEIDRHYGDLPQRADWRRFALKMLAPLAARLGTRSSGAEPSNIEILRGAWQEAAGRFDDAAILANARQRLDTHDGTPAEQRTALNIVAAQADGGSFDALLGRATGSADPLEKLNIFRALAAVGDPALARRLLDIAVSAQVPAGSSSGLIAKLAREHPDLVWDSLAPRLDEAQLPLSKAQRWRLAAEIAGDSAKPERIADLQAYEERNIPPTARKPFLASVASIRQNQHITAEVLPEFDRWIAAPDSTAPAP